MMLVDLYVALPHVRTGKIRALALAGGRRSDESGSGEVG